MIRASLAIVMLVGACSFAADEAKDKATKDKKEKEKVDFKALFDKAESLEVLALDPTIRDKPKDGFHGWAVLGKAEVKTSDAVAKVRAAVKQGMQEKANPAKCFIPRHGIRARVGKQTVDLVICFECAHVHFHLGEEAEAVTTSKSPEPTLDKILTDAGVKIAPKAEK